MNPEVPMLIATVVEVIILLRGMILLPRRIRSLAELKRRIHNPSYPITPKEIRDEGKDTLYNPVHEARFSVNLLSHQLNMIWAKYPDSTELRTAAKLVRHTIYSTISLMMIVFALMIVAVIITYPR